MELALLATVRDESPYLIDWIAHNRAIGFTRFVIYQNDSVDGTDTLLQALHDLGEITYIDNSDPADAPKMHRDLPPQRRAYARALRHPEIQTADYVFVADADEYLELPKDGTLPILLSRLDHPDVVCFPWRMMGSSGQTQFSPEPVTQRFDRAASIKEPDTERPMRQVKSLYRPNITRLYNLHMPRAFRPDVTWVDADGTHIRKTMHQSNTLNDFTFKTANLRHYHVKSFPEFCVKIVRGFACTPTAKRSQLGAKMFDAMDTNTVKLPIPKRLATKSAKIADDLRLNAQIADTEADAIQRYTKLATLSHTAVMSHETLPNITRRYRLSDALHPYFEDMVWSKMRTPT